jgi:iron complex outermembrane receptor protein
VGRKNWRRVYMFVRMLMIICVLFLSQHAFADEIKTAESEQAKSDIKSEEKSPAKDVAPMEEIVVTTTRTEKEVSDAPASVSVVTKVEIEKRNIKTIDEAVNTLPGVYNPRNIKGGVLDSLGNGGFTMRGVPGANRALFMMDGVVLNDSYSGSQYNDLGIAPENVERIEVVRGPFSSLYGGYAMGGVVNVITKMPEKREFVFKTGYGSGWERGEAPDDLRTFYLSYGDKFKDKLSLFLSYGYKATNGYPADLNVQSSMPTAGITGWSQTINPQGQTRYLIGDRGDKTWWDDTMTIKAGYDLTEKSKVSFLFTRYRVDIDYDDPHTYLKDASGNPVWSYGSVKEASFVNPGTPLKIEKNISSLSYETYIANALLKATVGMAFGGDYQYISANASTATRSSGPGQINNTSSDSYNADLQYTVPLWKRHLFTVGGSFQQSQAGTEKHDMTNWQDEDSKTTLVSEAKGKTRTYALFLQDEIMVLDNLSVYPGFRYDWWETYDGYFDQAGTASYPQHYDSKSKGSLSPKLAVVYKPFEMTTIRTSAGMAFRPPSVYELYSVYIGRGRTTLANPDLKPETNTAWDAGINQGLWKGAKIGITYFENYLEDLIYSQTVSETLSERKNVGKAESKGVEIEAEQRFDKWLRLFANFTYTNAKIKENDAKPEIVGKKLVWFPERMFNAGADIEKGPFSASLVGRYVSKRYSNDANSDKENHVWTSYDPYFVADAKVSYKLTKFSTVSFSVDNIFNRDYFSYFKAPGRSWFTQLTLKF